MRTAIVTDTNCGITPAQAEELGVHLIPMPFFIGGETYYEGKEITFDLFFENMRAGVEVSTSQPQKANGIRCTLTTQFPRVL